MNAQERGMGFGMGLLAGLAVGAILGLIFAPQEGKRTREMIKDKSSEWASRARDTWQERWPRSKEAVARAGSDLKGAAEHLRGQAEP